MKQIIKKSLLILATMTLLAGCGEGNDNGGGGEGDGDGSSSLPATKYAIVDRTSDAVTLTFDKTSAAKGETVTITVKLEGEYILTGLYANGTACTKVNDTTYTFVMGDKAVKITATLSIEGDVVINGDVAVALDEQADGTYKGSFTAENNTSFVLVAAGKEYGFMAIDRNRSYGDILQPGSRDSNITVGGNAVYDITFDASKEKPIIIYRTGILKAPSTASELNSYFCGSYAGRSALDGGTFNVKNVNHVSYRDSLRQINYTWDLHEDGSLATVTNYMTQKENKVYKSIKDNVYTVVDEYIETGKYSDEILDSTVTYYDRTKTQDKAKFSAKYAIVDEVGNSHYEKTSFDANHDMITPSHDISSINSEIHYGYYVGYSVEDDIKACNRVFSTETTENGGYKITIYAWKNYSDTSSVETRYQYDTSIVINADGTLSSVTFLETHFSKDSWNFDNDDLNNGGTAKAGMEGTVKRSSSVSYGYGSALTEAISFDTTPYFISSISNLVVKSKKDKTKEDGHVQYAEVLDESRRDPDLESIDDDSALGYTSVLKYDYAPSTALDSWQYGIISSDDPNVVSKDTSNTYQWIAVDEGTTEVTIGNHTTNDVTAKVSITVDTAPSPTGYYAWAYGSQTDDDVSSGKIAMKAGRIIKVYLWGSKSGSESYKCVAKPVVSCSNPNVTLSLSGQVTATDYTIRAYPAFILTIDASKVATDVALSETITVTDKRNSEVKSDIALTINPGTASLLPSSIEGTTWTAHNYSGVEDTDPRYMEGDFVAAKLSFTSEDGKEYDGTMYKKGTLTLTASGSVYNFYYNYYLGDNGAMSISLKDAGNGYSTEDAMVDFSIGGTTLEDYGLIGLWATEQTWSGQDSVETNYLIGYPEEEDDVVEYEWFTMDA